MMRYKIVARRMFGEGNEIVCRRCNHRILLPKDPHVIMYDDGLQMIVRDPVDRSLRHRCGRKLEWYCRSCKKIAEPRLINSEKRGRKGRSIDITCPNCLDRDLTQREALSPPSRRT